MGWDEAEKSILSQLHLTHVGQHAQNTALPSIGRERTHWGRECAWPARAWTSGLGPLGRRRRGTTYWGRGTGPEGRCWGAGPGLRRWGRGLGHTGVKGLGHAGVAAIVVAGSGRARGAVVG